MISKTFSDLNKYFWFLESIALHGFDGVLFIKARSIKSIHNKTLTFPEHKKFLKINQFGSIMLF